MTGIRAGRYHVLIRRRRKIVAYEKIPLALSRNRAYIPITMPPTPKQDPVEALRLHIAELRLIPDRRGLSGLLDSMLRALFISIFSTLADLVEQARARKLAAAAPAAAPETPPQAGRPEHPSHEAACGGGMAQGPRERPETPEPIAEPPRLDRSLPPPSQMPPVEPPAAPPLPPRSRVRKAKHKSRPAPARPRHVDDGRSRQPRGPRPFWTADAGFLRFDSKKWVPETWDSHAHFVTF